jgi:hypothetical protein
MMSDVELVMNGIRLVELALSKRSSGLKCPYQSIEVVTALGLTDLSGLRKTGKPL